MSNHSIYGPSSAHRWLKCPGSLYLCKDIPSKSSAASDEGTKAHSVLEAMLNNEVISDCSIEMHDYCFEAKEIIKGISERLGNPTMHLEDRVEFTQTLGSTLPAFGTTDCWMIGNRTLAVIDFKYGFMDVSADWNEQLMLYAAAIRETYFTDIDTIEYHIIQPRLEKKHKFFETSVQAHDEWLSDQALAFNQAVQSVEGDGVFFAPGADQCQWCPAKGACKAYNDYTIEAMDSLFDDETNQYVIDIEDLGRYLKQIKFIRDWCDTVEQTALARITNGSPVEGWKLVEGRGTRYISDTNAVQRIATEHDIFTEELFTAPELLSPAQLEKKFRSNKEFLKQLETVVARKAGKPTLAPAHDTRTEVAVIGYGDFNSEA